jgi:hypothetical protein|tara:strand:- start:6329 stop:6820 length:492 start_codon:yes stop_codon:yes gene_type:complete
MAVQDEAIGILKDLVATPNGQVRLWGMVLTGGSVFGAGFGLEVNPVLMIGCFISGVIFILLSIWMADRKAQFDVRRERRSHERPALALSDRTRQFVAMVDRPMQQHELADIDFLEGGTKDELIKTIRILRGREAAREGSLIYWEGGQYIPRISNDKTRLELIT